MSFDLNSIKRGAEIRPPRVVLLGVEKIGKSTMAAGADNPIFIPIKQEEGIDDLDVARFPVAENFNQVISALRSLYKEKHDFKTVVIDSASALEPVIWEHTCEVEQVKSIEKVGGGFSKGYTEALTYWSQLTHALDRLRADKGMAAILIGHVKVKMFNNPLGESFDQYQFDIHDKAANQIVRWADSILFANTKTFTKAEDVGFGKKQKRGLDTGQRFVFTQKTPGHPGGGRGVFGRIPYELPLSWDAFREAVKNQIQAEKEEKEKENP